MLPAGRREAERKTEAGQKQPVRIRCREETFTISVRYAVSVLLMLFSPVPLVVLDETQHSDSFLFPFSLGA